MVVTKLIFSNFQINEFIIPARNKKKERKV